MKNKECAGLELAKQFDVTTETIRSDLEKLENRGVLVRTYGGATLVETLEPDMRFTSVILLILKGKQSIGKCAGDMIKEGETVFLDASTSSLHLARNIKG